MSLRVWMPLTKDLRQQGLDSTTITQNSGTAISSGGKLGSCLTATSNATVVVNLPSLATMLANGKSYSLACWVKITGNVTTNSWIIKLGTNNCGLWWAASTARWVWNENDDGKRCADPTISSDTTNWHHLVTTVTKSSNGSVTTARHYVDGEPATSYEVQTWDNSGKAQPAGTTITISPYAASLNDIRLYDHCLSENEIKRLAQGLIVHYPLNRQSLGQENLVCGTHDWNRWIASSRASFSGDVATLTGSTADWAAAIHSAHLDKHLLDGSTTYTWSFEYKSTATWNCNPVIGGTATELGATSNSRTKYCYWQSALNLSSTGGVWKKYVLNSRTISESQMTSGSGDVNSWFLQIYNRTDDVAVNIRRIKLEKGTIATSYSKNRYDSIFEILTYDKALYIEPDGTQWIRIAHHNNPGNALFASTDSFIGEVYKDTNRWYQVEKACSLLNSNEFLVKQKNTSDSTEVKYRWKQTKSLLTATYSDVAPTAVTRIITTGYTDGSYGGLYIKGGNARLCIADGTDGDWWGAIGCWTTYQSGLPGYPKQVVTTGYIDLYIRVDNISISDSIEYDISGFGNNGTRIGGFTWSSNTPKYEVSTQFNGANYIKTLPGQLAWSNYDNLTISAWIKPTMTPSSWTGSIGVAHDGSYSYKLFGISNYGGKFTVHTVTGTAWTSTQSTYICPLNEWHHYVATLEGTTCKMYIDGVLNKTFTVDWGTATNHSSPQFQIGVDLPGTDEIYTGYYSDTRIYATALSADEVFELYHNF